MDWVVVEGVKPWDGRYMFDVENHELTTREWGWIKRFSGYLPLTLEEGWRGRDPELFAAFAVIALHRAGRIDRNGAADVFDRIADNPFGTTIRIDTDEDQEEADAGPPAGSSNGKQSSSGAGSTASSETSPGSRNSSGTPDSAISASTPEWWPS
jgi:hypothetical protein